MVALLGAYDAQISLDFRRLVERIVCPVPLMILMYIDLSIIRSKYCEAGDIVTTELKSPGNVLLGLGYTGIHMTFLYMNI